MSRQTKWVNQLQKKQHMREMGKEEEEGKEHASL
jgi:hypothetical protein